MRSIAIKLVTPVLSTFLLAGGLLQTVQSAPILTGSVSEERISKLTNDITWYTSLPAAEQAASKENKLILWVHMLGNLDGKT